MLGENRYTQFFKNSALSLQGGLLLSSVMTKEMYIILLCMRTVENVVIHSEAAEAFEVKIAKLVANLIGIMITNIVHDKQTYI